MAFPADNGYYSLTTNMSIHDPLRLAIRDGAAFDRFIAAVPLLAPWVERGAPVSEPEPLTRIDNRRRKLVDDRGPLVTGMALVGDAAVHTNPTLGRGVSLAFAQAQYFAETLEQAAVDPYSYAQQFARWTSANMGVWFTSQVANDAAALERLEAALEGKSAPQPTDEVARFTRALFALADSEPAVGVALARVGNLLITPAELVQDAEVVAKVSAYLKSEPDLVDRAKGPTRREFEALLA
jgi:2-polyprenyl-6-methoxyphenol hydroxylase-like FAD-dependent oxidoreductase